MYGISGKKEHFELKWSMFAGAEWENYTLGFTVLGVGRGSERRQTLAKEFGCSPQSTGKSMKEVVLF